MGTPTSRLALVQQGPSLSDSAPRKRLIFNQ
jgi:hypothetical protein